MDVESTELIRTSQSWDGVELPDYLAGRPELVADVTVAGVFVPLEPGALEDEFFIGVHTDDYYPSYLDKFTTF